MLMKPSFRGIFDLHFALLLHTCVRTMVDLLVLLVLLMHLLLLLLLVLVVLVVWC